MLTVQFELDGQPFTALNGGPEFTLRRGHLVPGRLRGPGRRRLLLGRPHRRRRPGGAVRLGQGQVRRLVAGRAQRDGAAAGRPRPGAGAARHGRDAADDEDRHRSDPARRRRRVSGDGCPGDPDHGQCDRDELPHDARRVPAARQGAGRLGGRLPRAGRGPAGALAVGAGLGAGRAAGRTPRSSPSPSRRCSPTSTTWCCPASRTGSRRRSSPTSRPTPRARRSSATCSRPGSACRGCSGPPRRRRPSSRRTSSTGWSSCSTCPRRSGPTAPAAASSRTARRARRWSRWSRPGSARPAARATGRAYAPA